MWRTFILVDTNCKKIIPNSFCLKLTFKDNLMLTGRVIDQINFVKLLLPWLLYSTLRSLNRKIYDDITSWKLCYKKSQVWNRNHADVFILYKFLASFFKVANKPWGFVYNYKEWFHPSRRQLDRINSNGSWIIVKSDPSMPCFSE